MIPRTAQPDPAPAHHGDAGSDGVVDVVDGEHDRCRPRVFGDGDGGSALTAAGVSYLVNSNRPDPSGVHIMTI